MYQVSVLLRLIFVGRETDSIYRWHLFTGIGAYTFIAVIDQLVPGGDHQDIDANFAWPVTWASQSVFAGVASTMVGADDKKHK